MSRKWWTPKVKKSGFFGVLHSVQNIFTEFFRLVLDRVGYNPYIKGKDLAYWSSHIFTASLILIFLFLLSSSTNG